MSTDNNGDDVDLGRRLSAALHAEAGRTEVPGDSWQHFQDRASPDYYVISDMKAVATKPVSTDRAPGRAHPWRVPLIAAAAVVAITVATTAAVTDGFGATHRVAAPNAGDPATPVRVPVDTAYQVYVMESGSGNAAPASSEVGTTHPSSWPGTPLTAVVMSFLGGTPPEATLSGRYADATGLGQAEDAQRQKSDGTPLGYVTHVTGVAGDAPGAVTESLTTLWGAVGPEVAQLQISGDLPTGDSSPEPESGTAEARWTIDSGAGTAFSAAGSETSTWTAIYDGWHGFAVQLPTDAGWVTVVALGADGQVLQDRRIGLDSGETTDLPVPPTSGQSASGSSTATTVSSTSGLAPVTSTADAEAATSPGYSPPGLPSSVESRAAALQSSAASQVSSLASAASSARERARSSSVAGP